MDDEKPNRWHRLQKLSFNKKDLTKRMRKAEGATVRHARKFIFRRMGNVREVRRHILIWAVAVGVLIGATGIQLMWYQQNYRINAPDIDGTYAEATLGPVNTMNPLFASTSAEESLSELMFSRLLAYDTSGNLGSDLATSVIVDAAGTTYTVKIRDNAKWHDGISVSSQDVAYTVGLLQNANLRSTIAADWSSIKVAIVDDNTLTFTLPAIIAGFQHALTFPIMPKHILSSIEPNAIRENEFGNAPIGSGPFKLRFAQDIDASIGRKIVHLERNDVYYKGAPKLQRFQLHVYDSGESILRALSNGEVNAAADLTGVQVAGINRARYEVAVHPVKAGVYALMNTTSTILKDKAVRQALQRGTDMKLVRDALPANTPAIDLPFVRDQLTGEVPQVASYDIEAAKKLLDDAGWKLEDGVRKKDGVQLQLSVVTTKDETHESILEALAAQWRTLGIVVNTQIVDTSDVSQQVVQRVLQPRAYDVLIYQLTIGADLDVFPYWHSSQAQPSRSGRNLSNYSNAIADDALSSARSRLEPSLRNAKYLTFARQWVSDVPAIGLYQTTTHYVYSKNATAFKDSNNFVSPLDRYADVLYWTVGTRTVFKTP
jgi:peptide/nickel transport system substrate-binding protein